MRYRPVADNGDMRPVARDAEILTGVEAVMGAVNSRLRLLRGEWWEDDTLGFRVPEFLFDGARLPSGPDMLASYITEYIGETENVTAVLDVVVEMIMRKLRYSCTVQTPFGAQEEEVVGDVLLRAIPG